MRQTRAIDSGFSKAQLWLPCSLWSPALLSADNLRLQIVLDVLGAMIELVEALACQRLALAPFTRQGANTTSGAGGAAAAAGESAAPSGLLRVSGHCYSVWAQPLHPVWLKVGGAISFKDA
jgi:hypothetical protein